MQKQGWKRAGNWALAVGGVVAISDGWAMAQGDAKQASETTCRTNLRQLATGMMMYVQDYDEVFPPAGKWSTVLQPYTKNRGLLKCPADTSAHSYAMNSNLSGASMAGVKKPAETVLLFESNLRKPGAA